MWLFGLSLSVSQWKFELMQGIWLFFRFILEIFYSLDWNFRRSSEIRPQKYLTFESALFLSSSGIVCSLAIYSRHDRKVFKLNPWEICFHQDDIIAAK